MSSILVIEDEDAVRENILELLNVEGYDAVGAPDGETGIRRIFEASPDLILCDVLMPGIDGYEVLARISKNPQFKPIPFLFLTARVNREDLRKGMNLGADDYITKPYTRAELLKAIETRLGKQKKQAVIAQQKLQDLRSQMVYSLPKDLIAPLSILLQSTDRLDQLAGSMEPAEVRQMASEIHITAQNIHQLVQNYLLLADLEVAQNDIQRKNEFLPTHGIDCAAIVQDMANASARQMIREVYLQVHMEPGKVRVFEEYFIKIVEELLQFIIQHSPARSLVQIEGVCLSEPQIYRLKLVQAETPLTEEQCTLLSSMKTLTRREFEQAGIEIGMVLVKQLVKISQGTFQVMTRAGAATQYEIALPLVSPSGIIPNHFWM